MASAFPVKTIVVDSANRDSVCTRTAIRTASTAPGDPQSSSTGAAVLLLLQRPGSLHQLSGTVCDSCQKRAPSHGDQVMHSPCPHCGAGMSRFSACVILEPWFHSALLILHVHLEGEQTQSRIPGFGQQPMIESRGAMLITPNHISVAPLQSQTHPKKSTPRSGHQDPSHLPCSQPRKLQTQTVSGSKWSCLHRCQGIFDTLLQDKMANNEWATPWTARDFGG